MMGKILGESGEGLYRVTILVFDCLCVFYISDNKLGTLITFQRELIL